LPKFIQGRKQGKAKGDQKSLLGGKKRGNTNQRGESSLSKRKGDAGKGLQEYVYRQSAGCKREKRTGMKNRK